MTLAAACQSDKANVLDDDKMEAVLYDIHRAHFVYKNGEDTRNDGAQQYALFLKVLEKHGVEQAQWDSSMVYYCSHADELAKIYDNLTVRLEREAELIGAATGEDSGDSTNIWRDERSIMVAGYLPYTTRQWSIAADTLLQPGEKLTLRFTGLFLQPALNMRAECLMAIRLKNDSVIVSHQLMSRTGIYNLSVTDTESVGIKEVKGMFMMHRSNVVMGPSDEMPVAQVLYVKDIMLLHNPQNEKPKRDNPEPALGNNATGPTLARPRMMDSVQVRTIKPNLNK